MIVFNGDAFIRESLRSVYDFAHEIFIVEGAVLESWAIANQDGSSTDATVNAIKNFSDPKGKIRLCQGKWETKEQMTNALISHVTGDYVWRLDSDEVYKEKDLIKIQGLLTESPDVSCVNIKTIDFFQGFDRIVVHRDDRSKSSQVDRIWKFEKGCRFIGHRPPDLYYPTRDRFMGQGTRIDGQWLAAMHGIHFYHYSYVTDRQVENKMEHYTKVYLKDYPIGVPFWQLIKRLPLFRIGYAWFFKRRIFNALRKKLAFPEMNFNYIETVWKPWRINRDAVEKKYGVTFNSSDPFVTIPFEGNHPKTMKDRILNGAR